jgi:hypothetical protein
VGELRVAGDDVADGEDAGLGGLHPFVGLDEAAIELDLGLLDVDVIGARGAAYGYEDFVGFLDLGFAVLVGEGYFDSGFGLFDLFDFGAGVDVDAAFFELAG